MTLASVAGGPCPITPMSEMENFESDYTRKLAIDAEAKTPLANIRRLMDIEESDCDAVCYIAFARAVFDLT